MNPKALKNLGNQEWRTPPWLFERLNSIFNFNVDGASNGKDNLLIKFINKYNNYEYQLYKENKVFINPPWNNIDSFLKRSYQGNTLLLLPFRPETQYFHKYIWPYADVFIFNKRINYINPETDKEQKGIAFPSCLVCYGFNDINKEMPDLGIWVKRI